MDYYERKDQKMIRIKNSEFIRIFENDKTISRIGKIDMNVINDNSIYSLYYKFPLIERIILERYFSSFIFLFFSSPSFLSSLFTLIFASTFILFSFSLFIIFFSFLKLPKYYHIFLQYH